MEKTILLTKKKLYKIVSHNYNYYKNFTPYDWKARGVKNYDEYLLCIKMSLLSIQKRKYESIKLKKAVSRANEKLEKLQNSFSEDWIDFSILKKINWVIGCMKGNLYEGGHAHTVYNTIIIPIETIQLYTVGELSCLLIHEKIHIFQRYYPIYTKKYLRLNQFTTYRKKRKFDRVRSNPDTNQYIYQKNGVIYSIEYKKSIKSVNSIVKKPLKYEHPYEEMAYLIEKKCREI